MRRIRSIPFLVALAAVLLASLPLGIRPGLAAGNPTPALPLLTGTPPSTSPTAVSTGTGTISPTVAATSTLAPTKPAATASPTASALPSPSANPTTGPIEEQAPPRHYVVLIVIDGAKPSYLTMTRLPHIQALMQHGVVYNRAWVGQLESSTPDVHVTFGTGTLPRENGFDGFGWAAPDTRRQVDFRTLLADGQIDPVLKRLTVPSVADRLHQFIPGAKVVASSGHKDYAAVGLGGGFGDYELYGKFVKNQFVPTNILGHTPLRLSAAARKALTLKTPLPIGAEDKWAFSYAVQAIRQVHPRLLMINVPEADSWGHWYGPANKNIFTRIMRNVDAGIGEIENAYQKLGILDRTDFILTADHGMMESKPANNWNNVRNVIKAAGGQMVRGDEEGGSIWLQNPDQAKMIAEKLVAMHPAHVDAIFYRSAPGNDYNFILASPKQWLAKPSVAGALGYLVNTTAGVNGPDVWVLYRENYTVVARNVSGQWKGTHGGPTWYVQHVPLVISGPGVRQGAHSNFPARAIDIAPTMERLLGLPAVKRDGVILADAFTNPMTGERGPQKAISSTLSGYINDMIQQSNADVHGTPVKWPAIKWPNPGCSPVSKQLCKTTSKTATNS